MIQEKNQHMKADQAWSLLYNRLEKDGLLPVEAPARSFRLQSFKWVAAIALLFVSLASVYFLSRPAPTSAPLLTLLNEESNTSLVTMLEDGSTVYLANQTSLQYPEYFSENKREVSLKGDALFEVSGNPDRPFFIETEEVMIEVIGTSFHVRNTPNAPFQLSVQRGKVKVNLKQADMNAVFVEAGETVKISNGTLVSEPTLNKELFSQFTKRIQFKDERLGDILNVLNRDISDIPIYASGSIEDRKLTVSFYENTPEDMAQLICLALKANLTREDGRLLISAP